MRLDYSHYDAVDWTLHYVMRVLLVVGTIAMVWSFVDLVKHG